MRMRVTRPTDRILDIARFYERGLGLVRMSTFRGHEGYDGIVLAAPDERSQLEFTTREGASAVRPAEDEHLVFYFDVAGEQEEVVAQMRAMGYEEVTPHNPWWRSRGTAFRDPDGWEVVLVRAPQASEAA